MQKYQDSVVKPSGQAMAGLSVRVQTYPDGVDATIYSDEGSTVKANPLTTDSKGAFEFYATNGRYQLVISGAGVTTRTITDILLEDDAFTLGFYGAAINARATKDNPTFTGIITASGGQIAFPATQVPSSNPNVLDDYEEGVFAPTLIGLTTTGAGTYTTRYGVYVKIGRLVFFSINIVITAHTGTGNMQITGLPFPPASGLIFAPLAVRANNLALTAGNHLQAYVDDLSTGSVIWLEQCPAGGGASAPVPMDTACSIMVAGAYFV